VIGDEATNERLDKEDATKVAQMAYNGLARTIRPAGTMLDGDTIFALSCGKKNMDVNIIGAYAAEVFARAILDGVKAAGKAGGIPACKDFG
jgi:L-aminopeptidase/D-esterase-like protein